MLVWTIPSALAAAAAASLSLERFRLGALRGRIPLRIAVTGTRGKSTVTRLIAAALRGDGRSVLAKVTGSRPVLIGPEGEETEIHRPGPPSILEQKTVLREAARRGCRVLVAEMMSIGPETLRAEARQILRPGVLVVTNARIDHREEMGRTRAAIAATLGRAFFPGATAFIPEEEMLPAFREAAARANCRLIAVPAEEAGPAAEFPSNMSLARAVAGFCGADAGLTAAGLAAAAPDFGSLRAWRLRPPDLPPGSWAVSLFAANEPDSTAAALQRLVLTRPGLPTRRVAVLALRADRADRTRQWLEAAGGGFFEGYTGIVAVGDHAHPVGRRLRRICAGRASIASLSGVDPARITAAAARWTGEPVCLIGMGNIVGVGTGLVEHWSASGEAV
jgi:gamma-polyglutamate synthase